MNSRKRLDISKISKVIHLLINNQDYSYSKIANIVGIGRKTVSGINNGTLYTDLAKKLGVNKYPIR